MFMKRGLEVYSHDVVSALRISISFWVLIPFGIKYVRRLEKKYWKLIIISGVVGSGIPFFLFAKGQTEIPSSLSGMLNSLVPFFTLIMGVFMFQLKVKKKQVIGVLLGLIGAVGLVSSNGLDWSDSKISYAIFPILATMCYAFNVNLTKYKLQEVSSMILTTLGLCVIGPFTTVYLFTTDFIEVTINHPDSTSAIVYTVFLAVLGTVIAVIAFYALIKKTSVLFATSVTYMIPLVAIGWGVLENEPINMTQVISMLVVLSGVAILSTSPKAVGA